MAKSTGEKVATIAAFLKDAFCIDGDCDLDLTVANLPCVANCFKLTDSKRGVFYVAIVAEKDMK